MDKIKIEGLHIYAHHGVHDYEKENGQNFYINATLEVDTYLAGKSDKLDETVSYSDVAKYIYEVFTAEKYDLIETAAAVVAESVLLKFDKIAAISIEVKKPEAPIGLEFDSVSVDITRKWHKVYLSFGSNMGDKQGYIDKAIALLKDEERIRMGRISTIIRTEPYGGVEQDDFLNGALEMDTLMSPEELLDKLHEIEYQCDRERKIHWGPRTLDLDILLYDDYICNTEKLTIPHIDMINRQFVLEPLCEIAPNTVHPTEGVSIMTLLHRLEAASEAATNSVE